MKKIVSKILVILMTIGLLYIPADNVYAASLSVSVSASTVKIGDTITVSVTVPGGYSSDIDMVYPSNLVSFESGSVTIADNGAKIAFTIGKFGSTSTEPTTETFKFKAKAVGTVSFTADSTVAGDATGMPAELGNGSATVTIVNEVYSDDNSLSIMYLSQGYISPDFDPSITTYRASVDYNVTSVRVTATPNHSKASVVSVTGNENLQVGENTISVVVKAESGATATYKIIVTRAEKPAGSTENTQNPTETQEPEEKLEGTDSGFDWGGKDLYFTEAVPEESAIKDFKQETVLINNLNVPCYKHSKSDLVVLNLKNDVDGGTLYVYDAADQRIYPYVKLEANDVYVIALLPDETIEAPKDYTSCTLSVEGKGTVTAYQYNAAADLGFYLLYCVNNNGQYGWYQYDSVEGTVQRYSGIVPSQDNTEGGSTEDTENTENDISVDGTDSELAAKLKEEENKNRMMICIFVFVVAVLLVVIFNLILFRKKTDDEDEFDEDEFEDEFEEYETGEVESDEEENDTEVISQDIFSEFKTSLINQEEEEVKVEFYEMAEEMPAAKTETEKTKKEVKQVPSGTNEDDDFEFIDLE